MTAKQIAECMALAMGNKEILADGNSLIGCGTPEFKRGFCTKEDIAAFLRWQCQFMVGGWDREESARCAEILKQKITLVTPETRVDNVTLIS
jgi:hypothetical protein